MTETQHIDPTGFGLLLVAAVSLPLALSNLLDGHNMGTIADILGLAIIVVAYFAYKANSTFGMTVFALVGIAVFLTGTGSSFISGKIGDLSDLTFGIIFVFFIIWAILIKGQKLLILLLVTTSLIFLILGIDGFVDQNLNTVLGVVALFNFIFNFWLGAGLVTEGKIPYF